ncbi:unnamed protein product, partial [Mesorhabditis spiculigera]
MNTRFLLSFFLLAGHGTVRVGVPQQNKPLGGYWAQPQSNKLAQNAQMSNYTPMEGFAGPSPFSKAGLGFPKKSNNWQDKKRQSAVKKPYDPTGKSPAMLLHELFKNVQERCEPVDAKPPGQIPKMYRAIVTVEGGEYIGEGNNKKYAKQKAAEAVLKALRPDIQISPWEDTEKPAAPKQEPPKKKAKMSEEATTGATTKANQKENAGNRVPPMESALSLVDLLRKMCLDHPGFEEIKMEHTNITEGDQAKVPPNKHKFRFTLSFPNQNKSFVTEGYGKTNPKDMAVREALTTLFGVSDTEIQTIVKRSLVPKLAQMNALQVLYHVTASMNREATFTVLEKEKEDVTPGPTGYYAELMITDKSNPDQKNKITGAPAASKMEAKLNAAKKANLEVFDIDMDNLSTKPVVPVPATQKLHLLLTKLHRGKMPTMVYEDLPSETPGNIPNFRVKIKINDKEEFFGVGKSKKSAKNDAAHQALKGIFKFDYDETLNNDPAPCLGTSKRCYEIAEFTKREYFQMCGFYGLGRCSDMAAFYLINEKDEKRLLSIGSCMQSTIEPGLLKSADGHVLVHMQSIVLARRSMIKYFMTELERHEADPESCIFMKTEAGTFRLKPNLRVIMYSTFAPDIRFASPNSPNPSLAVYGKDGPERAPEDQQTIEQAVADGPLRVHCVADKLFKWCHLGLQGALLSNVLEPIQLSSVYFGSIGQYEDAELRHAFYSRIGASVTDDTVVETSKSTIVPTFTQPHVWTRNIEHIETLDLKTGRTIRGTPSRLSKAELFESFIRQYPELNSHTYLELKQRSENYQTMKGHFRNKLAEVGLGHWQQKPESIDDFKAVSA